MNHKTPLVSIIVPVRNEEDHIGQCLESILNSDYPNENLEIIIVDGISEDQTKKIIAEYSVRYSFIRYIENVDRIVPTALNIGIKSAMGKIVIRMDAHSIYTPDYISKCVKYLRESDADNVGGICITIPKTNSIIAKAIAYVLSSPFGVGNSYFRIGINKSRYVDTVPFGCYRREIFDKVGLFNEKLVRVQDIEFNARLRKGGGKILLFPDIKSYYYARSTLAALCGQYLRTGMWKIYLTRMLPGTLSVRHFIPVFLLFALIGSSILSLLWNLGTVILVLVCGSYLFASLLFSFRISFKKGAKYFLVLPLVFLSLHFSYGLGMLWGIATNWRFSRR